VADYAVYHPLWFTRTQTTVMAGILDATPSVLAWMDRMAAIGHGSSTPMTAADAIAVCAASKGRQSLLHGHSFQDDHGIPLGSRVTITAESFGPEPPKANWSPPPAPTTPCAALTSAPEPCMCTFRALASC
jgi:hypothetical protein